MNVGLAQPNNRIPTRIIPGAEFRLNVGSCTQTPKQTQPRLGPVSIHLDAGKIKKEKMELAMVLVLRNLTVYKSVSGFVCQRPAPSNNAYYLHFYQLPFVRQCTDFAPLTAPLATRWLQNNPSEFPQNSCRSRRHRRPQLRIEMDNI